MTVSRTLKLTLAYDGTAYVGWQRQAEGVSIQGLVEDALSRLDGSPVPIVGAGRTDAGVHATGQVASARVSTKLGEDTILRALNAMLPPDVRVEQVDEVPPDFHARYSAVSKTYQYRICTSSVMSPFERHWYWQVARALDVPAMAAAAGELVGTHDFAAFQSTGSRVKTSTRNVMRAEWRRLEGTGPEPPRAGSSSEVASGTRLAFEIVADGFLRHMVRSIVGTLVEVGEGRRAPESVGALLVHGERGLAGPTAPAHGLFLVSVAYEP